MLTCHMFINDKNQLQRLTVHFAKCCMVSTIQVTGGLPDDVSEIPELPKVKGHTLEGGPQMIQLRSYLSLTPCAVHVVRNRRL